MRWYLWLRKQRRTESTHCKLKQGPERRAGLILRRDFELIRPIVNLRVLKRAVIRRHHMNLRA